MTLSYASFYKLPKTKLEQGMLGGEVEKAKKQKTAKMRDVSIRKHKPELKARAEKATTKGQRTVDNELRLLQKAANERMRQLEKKDIKSPAYQAVQAKLEILGKQRKGDRGRRFSETGRGTYNEKEMQKRILKEFLGAKTSTLTGSKDYYNRVWATANKDDQLTKSGISREQWFEFFENMPDSKKDRMFYSQQVKIFKSFMRKNGELVNEGKITVEEIANSIQEADKLNKVFSNLNDLYIEAIGAGAVPDKNGFITLKDI